MSSNIAVLFTFFDLCGFLTVHTSTRKYHCFACFIMLAHFVLAFFLAIYIALVVVLLFSHLNALEAFNEFSQYGCFILTYWAVLIESFVKRRKQRSFWNIYDKLNHGEFIQGKSIYIFGLIEYSIITISTTIVHIFVTQIPMKVMVPFLVLYFHNQFRVFYHIFYLKLINGEFQFIDHRAQEMNQLLKDLSGDNAIEMKHKFKEIRCLHQKACELIETFNEVFSFSNVIAVLSQFYMIYSNTNWLYLHGHEFASLFIFSK